MQPVARTTPTPPTTAPNAGAPAGDPRAGGGGVQGLIGDVIRSSAAGYQAVARGTAVEADKAAIHPFEAVSTATGLLKDKTAKVKGVNKATGLLHTIGGFAMLILTSNVSGTLRAPGETAVDVANRVADMIDGRDTAQGWNLGWGVRTTDGAVEPAAGQAPVAVSGLGAALVAAGMK
jgi:hypothetical protein